MKTKPSVVAGLVVAVLAIAPISSIAGSSANQNPSKEDRAKMAALHEKMAACLRSDRSLDECQNEMSGGMQQERAGQAAPAQAGTGDREVKEPDVRSGAAKRHSDLKSNSDS